tara:strand:+ start:1664 stop:2053 length:390 start_codon:yes stop_codon:yes gene_type:complete
MGINDSVRRYRIGEISHISVNQSGFIIKVHTAANVSNFTRISAPEGFVFASFASINGAGKVMARGYNDNGDDFAKDGVYDNSPSNSDNCLGMASSDLIYGRFDKILLYKDEVGSPRQDAQIRLNLAPID